MSARQAMKLGRVIPLWGVIAAGPLVGWSYALIQFVKVQRGPQARVHIDLRCTRNYRRTLWSRNIRRTVRSRPPLLCTATMHNASRPHRAHRWRGCWDLRWAHRSCRRRRARTTPCK